MKPLQSRPRRIRNGAADHEEDGAEALSRLDIELP
jgi:hypothetical protein